MNDLQWLNVMATAPAQGERHPKPKAGFGYVLDAQAFAFEPSSNPARAGVVYFRGTFTVVETEDPTIPIGSTIGVGINLTTYSGGSKARDMAIASLESFSGQPVQFTSAEQLMQAIAFLKQNPCPVVGRSRVFLAATAASKSDKNGQPYVDHAWQPMQPGSTKGLVAKAAPVSFAPPAQAPAQPWAQPGQPSAFAPPQAPPAQAPWAQPPAAPQGAPWAQQAPQGAPSFAPPAAPPMQAPAQPWGAPAPAQPTPGWPAGIPFTPGVPR